MTEKMSKEEAAAFEKVIKSSLDALSVFEETGQRSQFVATQDQIDAFQKEFGTKVELKFNKDVK